MNPLDLDRLSAWADGRLSAAEARALEAALAADPALRREAEALREVWRATDVLREAAPASRLSLARLALDGEQAPRPGPGRWIRYAAAAALALGALAAWRFGGLGGAGGSSRPESANVVLAAIPLASEPPEPPAALLRGYTPTRDGRPAWLTERAEARALARYVERPVLVYAHFADCPLCRQMDAEVFPDEGVRALLARVVPLQLDVAALPEDEARRLFESGWPYLALERPDGTLLRALAGMADAATLRRRLEGALAGQPAARWGWEQAVEAARGDAARREGRAALVAARDAAPTDATRARRELRAAATRLAGSAAGADLERVLAAWAPDAPFPTLEEARR